jgi:hypothetical protein
MRRLAIVYLFRLALTLDHPSHGAPLEELAVVTVLSLNHPYTITIFWTLEFVDVVKILPSDDHHSQGGVLPVHGEDPHSMM